MKQESSTPVLNPATAAAPPNHWLNRRWVGVVLPALFGLGASMLSVLGLDQYAWPLFLMSPFTVGFLAAFCWSYRRATTFRSAFGTALLSVFTLGTMLFFFALDGLICLVMALPLAVILALAGAAFGKMAGSALGRQLGSGIAAVLVLATPAMIGFEHVNHAHAEPPIRNVITSVEIDAPIGEVWQAVIAFPKIAEPPTGIFRLGIAYPIEARIEGHGVGAVRHCVFSTGSFVEPITTWNAPHHLAFDVTENPPPMRELSPYKDLHAPHLHGHMISKRGEFRLEETADGKVLLTGRTWYTHSMEPAFYWGPISDEIIHHIHRRVLEHIQTHTEEFAGAADSP